LNYNYKYDTLVILRPPQTLKYSICNAKIAYCPSHVNYSSINDALGSEID
jgi:hypothetical protein